MKKTLVGRVSETPKIKLIVSDVRALRPQSMLLSRKQMPDHVQTLEYVGL